MPRTPPKPTKANFLPDEQVVWADVVFPPATAAIVAVWHAFAAPSLPLAVRLLPVSLAVLPLLNSGSRPVLAYPTTRFIVPFVATGLTTGTAVALSALSPTATAIGIILSAVVLCVSSITTTRTATMACASLAAVTLTIASVLQGQVALAVLLTPAIIGCSAVLSWLAAELHWTRRWATDMEERLTVATADGQAGMFEIDVPTAKCTYSTRFRQVLGYDGFSEFPPLPVDFMSADLIWPDDVDRVQRTFRDAVVNHVPVTLECRMVTAMGEPRWVRLRASIRLGRDGTLCRIVGSVHDVSAQKDADARAREFLNAATQEIRAPLASIRGVHRLVSGGAFGDLPELPTRMMSIADRSSAKLEQLVDQLMELHSIKHGDVDLALEPVDLEDAVRAALQASHEVHHELFLSGPILVSHSCQVRADRTRLIHTLTTLMTVGLDDIAGGVYVGVKISYAGGIGTVVLTRNSDSSADVLHSGLVGILHTPRQSPKTDVTDVSLSTAKALLHAMGGIVKAWSPSEGVLSVRVDLVAAADPGAAQREIPAVVSSASR